MTLDERIEQCDVRIRQLERAGPQEVRMARILTTTVVVIASLIATATALRYVGLPLWMAQQHLCERPIGGVAANLAMAWMRCDETEKK